MPSARPASERSSPASARTRARATSTRPQRVTSQPLAGRVRWDRLARVGLLIVLGVVTALWVKNGLSWLGARSEAARQAAAVRNLERANASLEAQARSLANPATIQRDARALGMVKAGERSYVVTGLGGGH